MSELAQSKVAGIVKSLSVLENDLESLNSRVDDMKKQLAAKAQAEIDSMSEKTRQLAAKEAEAIISASRQKAEAESARISQQGEARLSELRSGIDAHFDEAVQHVVSTILKA